MRKYFFLLCCSFVLLSCEQPTGHRTYPWSSLKMSQPINSREIVGEINSLSTWVDASIYVEQMELPTTPRFSRVVSDLSNDFSDRTAEQAVLDWVFSEENLSVYAKIHDDWESALYANSFTKLEELLIENGVSEDDKYIVGWGIADRTDLVTGDFMTGVGTGFGVDTIGLKPAILDWDTDMTPFYSDGYHDGVFERFGNDQVITVFLTRSVPHYQTYLGVDSQYFNGVWIAART